MIEGSTDGTWELAQQMAREDSRLILYRHESVYFRNDLRTVLLNEYRNCPEAGDWLAMVGAAEFYDISPPEFVYTRPHKCETAVSDKRYDCKANNQASLRLREPSTLSDERKLSTRDGQRCHSLPTYSKRRLFEYRSTMHWVPPRVPYDLGFTA
jgi:hypothetical protein